MLVLYPIYLLTTGFINIQTVVVRDFWSINACFFGLSQPARQPWCQGRPASSLASLVCQVGPGGKISGVGGPTFLTFHHTPKKKGGGAWIEDFPPQKRYISQVGEKEKTIRILQKCGKKDGKKGICFWDLHLPHPGCQSQVVKVSGFWGFLGFPREIRIFWVFQGSFRWVVVDPWQRRRKRTPLRLQHRSKAKRQVAENPWKSGKLNSWGEGR